MRTEAWLRLMSGIVLVLVFAAGVLFGAGLMRWTGSPPPPQGAPGPIDMMTHELGLDADQIARLRAIADVHRGELEGIMREAQPKIRSVLFAIEDELRPHLRPEQIQRLEQWRAHRPPPPMPGMGPPPRP